MTFTSSRMTKWLKGALGSFSKVFGFTKVITQLAAALASAALAWYSANLEIRQLKLWNSVTHKMYGLWNSNSRVGANLPVFQLWPEVPDKTLNWPGSAVSQSTDGVALNLEGEVLRNISLRWSWVHLFAQFPNHINLLWLCVAFSEPPHHCVHPVNALVRFPMLHIIRRKTRSHPNTSYSYTSLTSLQGVHWPHDSCL